MRIPKRFELHLAAGEDQGTMQYDAVRIEGRALVATDGIVAARIPIGNGGVRPEPGEDLVEGAAINPKAWAAAVQGSTGEGTLRLSFGAQTAVSGDRKPSMVFAPPETPGERPPIGELLRSAAEVVDTERTVRIMLDAEALHRLARALGSQHVELRFEADEYGNATSEPAFVCAASENRGAAYGAILPLAGEDSA